MSPTKITITEPGYVTSHTKESTGITITERECIRRITKESTDGSSFPLSSGEVMAILGISTRTSLLTYESVLGLNPAREGPNNHRAYSDQEILELAEYCGVIIKKGDRETIITGPFGDQAFLPIRR